MGRLVAVAGCSTLLLIGCACTSRTLVADAASIEPLDEAGFDAFATRLAGQISAMLDRHGYWPPAAISLPLVEPAEAELDGLARAFARRLAEGLNDRLQRAAIFRPAGPEPPDLRSTLRLEPDPATPGRGTIVFRLFDEQTGRERLVAYWPYVWPREAEP